MNMAKIEARTAELHEGCRMPMEQARELAASEMSEGRKALLAAFGAAAAAREQDLRGQYPKAARVLAEEVFSLRAALRQKQAEYEDMKSLLRGNVRNVHLEGERSREVLRRMLEAPTTQISVSWKDAARQGLALGPATRATDVELDPLRRLWPLIERGMKDYVFTGDKAGEVAADMAALRKSLGA